MYTRTYMYNITYRDVLRQLLNSMFVDVNNCFVCVLVLMCRNTMCFDRNMCICCFSFGL